MSNAILTRDESSAVNCFAVHRASGHVSVRCSKPFAQMLRHRVENRAEGFGGVVFQEVGRGWYELVSRDALNVRPDEAVDEATAQLFLEFAYIELTDMMASLNQDVTVITAHTKETHALREVRSVVVTGAVSSRPIRPALSVGKWNQLANFAQSNRIVRSQRRH